MSVRILGDFTIFDFVENRRRFGKVRRKILQPLCRTVVSFLKNAGIAFVIKYQLV